MNLKPNTLTFIGLCREYCSAIEQADTIPAEEFVANMVRLLPRIYITATDMEIPVVLDDEYVGIDSYLEEDYYESLRVKLENMFGPDDVYLEVFEDEMKYSDTPIRASLSEGLCDLFQTLYNFMETFRNNVSEQFMAAALQGVYDEFKAQWGQTLVNLMRPLNALANKSVDEENDF